MRLISPHHKDEIESLLRRNTYLHLYSIGDLDDFFWQFATWYGLEQGGPPVLLYAGSAPPVLLALTDEPSAPTRELSRLVMPLLPCVNVGGYSRGASRSLMARPVNNLGARSR